LDEARAGPLESTEVSEQQRKLQRQQITTTVTIENVLTGTASGELVNITAEGLMMISDHEVDTNSIFQFALILPEAIDGSRRIELGVDCLWCRKAEIFDRYWSGYQIIDASPQALRAIEVLIDRYAG
jgi:hypothetical protein